MLRGRCFPLNQLAALGASSPPPFSLPDFLKLTQQVSSVSWPTPQPLSPCVLISTTSCNDSPLGPPPLPRPGGTLPLTSPLLIRAYSKTSSATAAAQPATAASPTTHPNDTTDSVSGHPSTAPHAQASASAASSAASSSPPAPLSFSDHRLVFEGQSTWQLLRAYGVLRLCGVKPFVDHAEALLSLSHRLLGSRLTEAVVKATFFAHFCAGEDVREVRRTAQRLQSAGVGSILDYAAEDDVGPSTTAKANRADGQQQQQQAGAGQQQQTQTQTHVPVRGGLGAATASGPAAAAAAAAAAGAPEIELGVEGASERVVARAFGVVGRTYDYASEEQCDKHVQHFLSAIEMAAQQPGRPAFAAIKMTALGNPALLQRASTALTTLHGLFRKFDEDGSGTIDSGEFDRQFRALVGEADPRVAEHAARTYSWLQERSTEGRVDYVSWTRSLELKHMPMLAARIAEGGGGGTGGAGQQVAEICLDEHEVELMDALLGRLQMLVTAALRHNVCLMVDAEHTYFQPAIEHVVLQLMREHNRGAVRVLNTYQAYLTDCRGRLLDHLEVARREGWMLGAKLVRGAYLHLERRRAEALGYLSPIWPELQDTHAAYNACAADLIRAAAEGRAQVLLGTHNQDSVESAVQLMAELRMAPGPGGGGAGAAAGQGAAAAAAKASGPGGGHGEGGGGGSGGVMFGQLLGMSDHLTLTLGKAGYRAYKYVPYGKVGQVMPYLLRRAAENSDILKGSKHDLEMLRMELARRARAAVGVR